MPTASTPTVTPNSTTTYYVELNDNGCLNKDSVIVSVTDHVSLEAMNDTTICQDDIIQLRIISDGFQYVWTPSASFVDANAKNPFCLTHNTTRYEVTAYIGSCFAKKQIVVSTVPYPVARAGEDIMICHDETIVLNGSTDGKSVLWSPAASLSDPFVLNPVARPGSTTNYILLAYDNKGCPKPGSDTVVVIVLPDIKAFAGRDTAVVIGQPLQLLASGGVRYEWSPAIGLSATNIPNPIGFYNNESDIIRYRVLVFNEANCLDSAFVSVKIFKTAPQIFVPNAFSPDADGHNDVLRPVLAGITRMEYFNVYSRWGQLVFSTVQHGSGWDGRISGQLQGAGSYVWMVKAIDYKGEAVFRKGVVMLVR